MVAHPSTLFGSGEYGYALDPTDPGAVWQQVDGSMAGAAGQPVGRLDDVSGNGRHFAAAANDTTRPTLQADGSVLFDGSNDVLKLDDAGLWDAGEATIVALIQGDSQSDRRWWGERWSGGTGPFYQPYTGTPAGGGTDARAFNRSDSSTTIVDGLGGVTLFDDEPHIVRIVDTGSAITIYVDGVAGTTRSYSRSLSLTTDSTGLGAFWRGSATAWWAGRIKRGIWIGRLLDAGETADMLEWVAGGTVHQGEATLDGSASSTASAGAVRAAETALTGDGELSAVAARSAPSRAALAGTSALLAEAKAVFGGAGQFHGVGTLTATPAAGGTVSGEASLSGRGSIIVRASLARRTSVGLSAASALAVAAKGFWSGRAHLAGTGLLRVRPDPPAPPSGARLVPVDAKRADWPRLVANAINSLNQKAVTRGGTALYTAPTISNPPTSAEIQAIADALAAISARLE